MRSIVEAIARHHLLLGIVDGNHRAERRETNEDAQHDEETDAIQERWRQVHGGQKKEILGADAAYCPDEPEGDGKTGLGEQINQPSNKRNSIYHVVLSV